MNAKQIFISIIVALLNISSSEAQSLSGKSFNTCTDNQNTYIVYVKKNSYMDNLLQSETRAKKSFDVSKIIYIYRHAAFGFAAQMNCQQYRRLQRDNRILQISEDSTLQTY